VNACTDITGFGLVGHLNEMTRGSNVNAEIVFSQLPFMKQVKELALAGAIPGGTHRNYDFYKEWIRWNAILSDTEKLMFCDAQTSGGLLVSIPEKHEKQVLKELSDQGVENAVVIGRISEKGTGLIEVV
jgi:selenide,water dikinase